MSERVKETMRKKFMRKQLKAFLLISVLGVAAAAAAAFVNSSNSVSAQSDWATFWTKFKTAVARGDKKTISSLSESQNYPAEYYQSLFGTRARKNCFAKAKPARDENRGGYNVFCSGQGYYFDKVNGQYRFKEAFADD